MPHTVVSQRGLSGLASMRLRRRRTCSVTVSVDVFVEASQATPFFIWGLGNPATSGSGTGYLFSSGNAFRAGITTGNWSGEKVTARASGGALARGVWKSVTYTQTGTTGTLYEDGALHPGVELTGRFERSDKPVDLESVMLEIDAPAVDITLSTWYSAAYT